MQRMREGAGKRVNGISKEYPILLCSAVHENFPRILRKRLLKEEITADFIPYQVFLVETNGITVDEMNVSNNFFCVTCTKGLKTDRITMGIITKHKIHKLSFNLGHSYEFFF